MYLSQVIQKKLLNFKQMQLDKWATNKPNLSLSQKREFVLRHPTMSSVSLISLSIHNFWSDAKFC